ncbi:hypothetical protein GQR36_02720 [Enterococcus termitis]
MARLCYQQCNDWHNEAIETNGSTEYSFNWELAQHFDVYYHVHAKNFGWMDWASNGQDAGTSGFSYQLESIEIRLVKKELPHPAQ